MSGLSFFVLGVCVGVFVAIICTATVMLGDISDDDLL